MCLFSAADTFKLKAINAVRVTAETQYLDQSWRSKDETHPRFTGWGNNSDLAVYMLNLLEVNISQCFGGFMHSSFFYQQHIKNELKTQLSSVKT